MSLELPVMSDNTRAMQTAVSGLSESATTNAAAASQALALMGSWSQWGAVGILGSVTFVLVIGGSLLSYFTSKADRAQHASDIQMTISAQHSNVETLAKSQERQIDQISRTWEAQTRAMTTAVEANTKSVEKLAEKMDRRMNKDDEK